MEKVVRGLQCCSGVMVVGPLTMSIYECMIMSSMTASDMLYWLILLIFHKVTQMLPASKITSLRQLLFVFSFSFSLFHPFFLLFLFNYNWSLRTFSKIPTFDILRQRTQWCIVYGFCWDISIVSPRHFYLKIGKGCRQEDDFFVSLMFLVQRTIYP